MIVTEDTNFCRVFELPKEYTGDYTFGQGQDVTFLMVDWFNPVPHDGPFKWTDGTITLQGSLREGHHTMIKDFILSKPYIKDDRLYIIITDYNDSFILET